MASCVRVSIAILAAAALSAPRASAAPPQGGSLPEFNGAVQALVRQVAPSVVQIVATGYASTNDEEGETVLDRQRSIGSGVVVDRDGYIMTNEHVVSGATRVEVIIAKAALDQSPEDVLASTRERTAVAQVVGVSRDLDLALLKVDAGPLTPLPIADYGLLRQGEVVFAFGSPAGLSNSVTMGVVSAVGRQRDPDDPRIYIQTDAPINQGNSGGPLVNAKGELVGINTFIVTTSGGNEGLGFAIPSTIVEMAVPALRTYGKMHRAEMGVQFQTITPDLATGLGLPRSHGVIVADVEPDGPAEKAGVQVGDIVTAADGKRVELLSSLLFQLYTRAPGDIVKLELLRGPTPQAASVQLREHADGDRLTDLVDPAKSHVERLGVLAIAVDDRVAQLLPDLRMGDGVLIAARVRDWRAPDVALSAGDVIHAVNGRRVTTLESLRVALDAVASGDPVVLQMEHNGQLSYVTFEAP